MMPSPAYFREAVELEAGHIFGNHLCPEKALKPKGPRPVRAISQGSPVVATSRPLVHFMGLTVAGH